MKKQPPLISVIIPARNYAAYLGQTLGCVLSETATEAVVVDDGSTDKTAEVARSFGERVRYLYQEHQGPAAARNAGLELARGDFLVFLDADDLLYPGTLSSQRETLLSEQRADLAVCRNKLVRQTETGAFEVVSEIPLVKDNFELNLCRQNIAPVHAFMIRRDVPEKAGFFDPRLRVLEDYDFWLRCAATDCALAVNERGLVLYRRHGRTPGFDESGLRLYGCELRQRVARLLLDKPTFLADRRPDAWLAHASSCLELASQLQAERPEAALEMLELGTEAVKQAAKEIAIRRQAWVRTKSSDAILSLSAMRIAGYAADLFLKGRSEMERVLEIIEGSLPEYNYPPAERPDRVAVLNGLLAYPPLTVDLSGFRSGC